MNRISLDQRAREYEGWYSPMDDIEIVEKAVTKLLGWTCLIALLVFIGIVLKAVV